MNSPLRNENYKLTKLASYIGYITQAIVNNLAPLLFVTFSNEFNLTLDKLSLLITFNFGVQILTDLISAKFINQIGYRRACVMAHVFATLGLISYGILPFMINPFIGLLISSIICAIGGGLDEVIISPVMEAIPGDAKASDMSLLHSFYCWGQVGVVVLSTLYFNVCGINNWRFLPFIWAIIPFMNIFLFAIVPIRELNEDNDDIPIKNLFKMREFWLLLVVMVCAGASELAMSQWASLFAEKGLNVSKTMGDLLGPCMFAVFMGISRVIYGFVGNKIKLEKFMIVSGALCALGYLITTVVPQPIIALMGCGICGFAVGIMWPGTYSLATRKIPLGGAGMFAILALAGDIGCTSGPDIAGIIGNFTGDIKKGLFISIVFPIVLLVCVMMLNKKRIK